MSKRFGRNQKRKLMQQLASHQHDARRFENAYRMSDGLLSHMSSELDNARNALRMIYSEIGKNLNPHHPLLPNDLRRQLSVAAADIQFVRVANDRMNFKVVEILRKRLVTDEFRGLIAARIDHGDNHVGYAIDVKSLLVESFRVEFINDLSREISMKLVSALGRKGGAA